MFKFVQERKRFVQIMLLIIILPFTFWGMNSFNKSGSGDSPATVNGSDITQQEFDQELRQQQEAMKEQLGSAYDPTMFDSPQRKRAILDNLINQRLLILQASEAGLAVSDYKLAQAIAGIKTFQKDGKFDKQLFDLVLRSQKRSAPSFEADVAQQLQSAQLVNFYLGNGYASRTAADYLVRLNDEKRVVAVAEIAVEPFLTLAKVDEAAIRNYYDTNQKEFQIDEQVRVEYVTFSADALQSQVAADETEIRRYYDERQAEFGSPEQRHASHILISLAPEATEADKQAAKAKAEQVLQQVRQAPAKFSDLAKQHSQDPGSAAKGGDLGTFGRGAMVKPFEDAVFSLKPGEVSGLVQSDFGYHIIKLLAVEPAQIQPLDKVRNDIAQKIRQQKAKDKFAELAEKFSNMVYEQSDTLKPAAELVRMPVQQSAWVTRGRADTPPFTGKALQAIFSDDVLSNKRNSSAVEISPNTLLAARLLEHKPASMRPLAEVSDPIRQKLIRQRALELAVNQGQTVLAAMQGGEKVNLAWKPSVTITRAKHTGVKGNLAALVFQASADKLPAYVGAENGTDGYVVARIDEVQKVGVIDEASRAQFVEKLRQLTSDAVYKSYLADAKKNSRITTKEFAAAEK